MRWLEKMMTILRGEVIESDMTFKVTFRTIDGSEVNRTILGADSKAILPRVLGMERLIPGRVVKIEEVAKERES